MTFENIAHFFSKESHGENQATNVQPVTLEDPSLIKADDKRARRNRLAQLSTQGKVV